jgi:hypothetical protein
MRCQRCNQAFTPTAALGLSRNSSVKDEKTPAKRESFLTRLAKKSADTAVMLDGAIGGSIGGIIVGILVGSIAGSTKQNTAEDVVVAIGGALTGIFIGFVYGFGIGALIGLLLGACSKLINYLFEMKSKQASVASGVLAGAVAAMALANARWALIGAVLGGVGAVLWSLINGWAEGYMPPTPQARLARDYSEEDDRPSKRWTIDQSVGDYPGGRSDNGARSPQRF